MQEEDRELFESGAGGSGEAEGAPPPDLRLARGVHEGGTDEPAESVLALANPADDPVSPSDVCAPADPADGPVPPSEGPGAGAFDFLGETGREACVGYIKAFVRGGRCGLERLQKVLPSIFRTFQGLLPYEDVLIECGLEPMLTTPASEFPTFYFNPLLDGAGMVRASRKRPLQPDVEEDVELYRSQELLQAYEAVRSEWSSS